MKRKKLCIGNSGVTLGENIIDMNDQNFINIYESLLIKILIDVSDAS